MSNTKLTIGLVIVAVIAIIGLFSPLARQNAGAVANVTTNLPSLGLSSFVVGSGCDQQYSSCTSTLSIPSGATNVGIGSTTPSTAGDLVIDSTGTSSLIIMSSSATKGGGIQIDNTVGSTTCVMVSGTSLVAVTGACR